MESNTRRFMRSRLNGFALNLLGDSRYDAFSKEKGWVVEEWLKDFMQTPELSLAELADSKPEYRLAVVDAKPYPQKDISGDLEVERFNTYRVVKMEDK